MHSRSLTERDAHLHFLESMDRINRAMHGTNDLEQALTDVLDAVLEVFECDRAWLVYPCDPDADSWRAVMERTRPEYPGAFVIGQTFPMTESVASTNQALLASSVPLSFGTGIRPLPDIDERYSIRSILARAVRPRLDKPFTFGLHQCSHARVWTHDEERLFEGIGRRLEDALTSLLMFRRLRASEARLAMAQRVAQVGHWEEDLRTGACVWSDETHRIFGVGRDVPGPTMAALAPMVHADDRERFVEDMERLRRLGTPSPFTFEYRTSGGDLESGVVQLDGNVTRDARGAPAVLFGVVQDITHRRRAEQELRASEGRFREFVDHATDGLFIHDRDGIIVDVNRQACESLGYTRDELLGMRPDAFDADTPGEVLQQFGDRLDRGEVLTFETRHRRRDGVLVPVEVRVRPFREDGQRYAISMVRDISERRRALDALQASHGLLRAVVEGTSDAVFVKDLDGRYLSTNAAGAELLGRVVAEVVGKTDVELQTPAHDTMRARELRVISTGGSQTFEHTATWTGVPRTYLSTTSPYRDGRGTVLGVVWISRDVTELKRLEEQFRQSQKMEAVGRLAGGIAHDFNNLLTVINGYCEMVFSSMDAEDPNRELIAEVQKAGERAGRLTRQLLAFSRKQMLQPRAVDLNALVDDLHHLLRRLISEDVDLELRLAPDLGMARVDPGQFEQAIINLAVNARDAMPEGGRLTIETCNAELVGAGDATIDGPRDGAYICVALTDVGHGMDDTVRGRIFEPFFTTKEQGKGTGLGLAMVYGFVIQSGGHIEVESEPGAGATFRLYLPRDVARATPSRGVPEAEPQIRGTETLLLVEDEESVRSLSRLILQSYGYTVLEASNGEEGLRVAQGHEASIHLLVTDLVMPRMSGRRLADVLSAARPGLRVLLLSGYTDETVIRHDVVRSGFAFLHKPFTAMGLARKVREVLDQR